MLYDDYSPALLGVIVRIVNDKELAEEILQKSFLKIWQNIDSYDSAKGSFFTWILTIARHSAIDEVRSKRFENLEKTNSLETTVYELDHTILSSDGIDVNKLLSALDQKYKDVLDVVYLQGYSHSEAAKKLDIPLGTVKTRIKKALSTLRSQLITEKTLFRNGMLLLILISITALWQ
jgi:RNA polymerase sigma-70 factor (ECF subfamily)